MSRWNHRVGYVLLDLVSLLRNLCEGRDLFFLFRKEVLWCLSFSVPTWCRMREWHRIGASYPQVSTCLKFQSNFHFIRGSWRGTQEPQYVHSGWHSGGPSNNGPLCWPPRSLSSPNHSINAVIHRCVLASSNCIATFFHWSSAAWSWSDPSVQQRFPLNSQAHITIATVCLRLRLLVPFLKKKTSLASVLKLIPLINYLWNLI